MFPSVGDDDAAFLKSYNSSSRANIALGVRYNTINSSLILSYLLRLSILIPGGGKSLAVSLQKSTGELWKCRELEAAEEDDWRPPFVAETRTEAYKAAPWPYTVPVIALALTPFL